MSCYYITHPGPQADVMVFYCSTRTLRLSLFRSITHPGPQADVMVFYCSPRALRLLLCCSFSHPGPKTVKAKKKKRIDSRVPASSVSTAPHLSVFQT